MTDRPRLLFLHPNGKVSRRLPLPWRTRLRIRVHHRVDSIADWLIGHGHESAAAWLWRACRMW